MDWDSFRTVLETACARPDDDEAAEAAIGAAEIVAAAAGEPPDELPVEARAWVETHGLPDDDLLELAYRAMKALAAVSPDRHDRLNDLRYRLGDLIAA